MQQMVVTQRKVAVHLFDMHNNVGEPHKVLTRCLMILHTCLCGSETSNNLSSTLHASLSLAVIMREQFRNTSDVEQGRKGGELDIE